ncbi:MAG: hypothetical protein ACE5NP_12490 [Anaerolineae bacterium]
MTQIEFDRRLFGLGLQVTGVSLLLIVLVADVLEPGVNRSFWLRALVTAGGSGLGIAGWIVYIGFFFEQK